MAKQLRMWLTSNDPTTERTRGMPPVILITSQKLPLQRSELPMGYDG